MKDKMKIFVASSALLLAVGCAHQDEPNRGSQGSKNGGGNESSAGGPVPSSTTPGPPILWAIGGWNSCNSTKIGSAKSPLGMNIFKNFGPMYSDIKQKSFPQLEYFASCMQKDPTIAYTIHSDAPDQMIKTTRENAYQVVLQRALTYNSPLVIIGHSYGGWIAMVNVAPLANAQIPMLLTLDAISPITCDFTTVASALQEKLSINILSAPAGCTTSPTDITEAQKNQIRSKVGRWVNIWQADSLNALHASPIAQAENERVTLPKILDQVNGHIALGLHPTTWLKIRGYIDQVLVP